jgi:hypothetical protein
MRLFLWGSGWNTKCHIDFLTFHDSRSWSGGQQREGDNVSITAAFFHHHQSQIMQDQIDSWNNVYQSCTQG